MSETSEVAYQPLTQEEILRRVEEQARRIESEWRSRSAKERVEAAVKLLRDRATTAATGMTAGQWGAESESCDCGDGYGCSHGSWISAVNFEKAITEIPEGKPVESWHKSASTEVPTEAMEWMLTIQPAAGFLLAELLEMGSRAWPIPKVVELADAILATVSPIHADEGLPNAVSAGLARHPWEIDADAMRAAKATP